MRSPTKGHVARALGVVALLLPAGITDLEAESATAPASPVPAVRSTTAEWPSGGTSATRYFVFFAPNDARIEPAAERILRRLVADLGGDARFALVVRGRSASNETSADVGDRRARAVRNHLAGLGVPAERITVAEPAPATTPLAEADPLEAVRDRRVDILVSRPDRLRTVAWTKREGGAIYVSDGPP